MKSIARRCAGVGRDLCRGPPSPRGRRTRAHERARVVSIVLPTRNGAATLPAVLDAISRQQVDFPFEIVAVDSSSTDGTVDLLRGRADRLISIPRDEFDHGLTRNLGIEHASGELIVLLVQDALPASDSWLAALTAPLIADEVAWPALCPPAPASRRQRHHALLPRALGRVVRRWPRTMAVAEQGGARRRWIRWRSSSAVHSTTSARASGDRSGAAIRSGRRRSPKTSSGRERCCWPATAWHTCRWRR